MTFKCCDCGHVATGIEVIEDTIQFHIVKRDVNNPINSTLRCDCCQDDYDERNSNDY